jgi:predicted lipid-binding transport protein (Tim44 family)
MMKKFLVALCIGVMSLGLSIGDAEAKRLGGGKSSGTQRESVTQKQATPTQNSAAPATAPAAAPAAAPKRNWMGPLAGLAAGLGIAALLSHFGMGEGMGNFLMIALLAMAAFFVIRMFFGRKAQTAAASDPLQYAGANGSPLTPPPPATGNPGYATAMPAAAPAGLVDGAKRVPDGFDIDGFLRIAKLNFIRLQASNDAKNLDDIREFVSPEMFAEIKMQMSERGATPQETDVVTLNAELIEVVTEGQQHIASVRFSGMIREETGAAAAPFDEVWNLTKQVEGNKGWTISGIQQIG